MGTAIRTFAGLGTAAALTLATLTTTPTSHATASTAPVSAATTSSAATASAATTDARQAPSCRYVNMTDNPAPIRLGPGKKYRKRAELAPSEDPIRATCAARGRGRDHWVQLKSGEHKGLWVWRNRLQTWSG
ncbi:hypothetical protein AB0I81_06230 [Nonomuraea sp. NPDC050404]|uniref:hypothetical protein n=1 Tax=Nonomuraea sp. NPDC050404 TaxID=3155783 RepID=UPI0033D776AC